MAKAKARIEEKTPGVKIAVRQSGNKVIFGDDDISVNCANRQREYPVTVDIFTDREANLQTGAVDGGYYVAQVEIPAYDYVPVTNPDAEASGDAGGESGTESGSAVTRYEPAPIDMGKVTAILWGLDNIPATIRNQLATQDDEQED